MGEEIRDGGDLRGKEIQKGVDIDTHKYTWLIHLAVYQKQTQYRKATKVL